MPEHMGPERLGPEWLIETGIGEHRAVRIEGDHVVAARIDWPGSLAAGQIEDAVLISRAKGSSRGTVRFAGGQEALVDRLPRDAQQGGVIRVEVTRSALFEKSRVKRAQCRPAEYPPRPAPSLAEALAKEGNDVRIVRHFPAGHWEEIWAEAWSGFVDFSGGSLHFSATPAMVMVDVDGTLPPRELSLAAVEPLAGAIRRFDLAGSIGIDFPTLAAKADRRMVDDALCAALADWPHERTGMNGFGFVQIVSRLTRPSVLHLLSQSRTAAAARLLLRRAEEDMAPGALLLICHPAVGAQLTDEWLAQLARRTGREIRVKLEPGLALEGGFAQSVPL